MLYRTKGSGTGFTLDDFEKAELYTYFLHPFTSGGSETTRNAINTILSLLLNHGLALTLVFPRELLNWAPSSNVNMDASCKSR